MEVLLRVGKSPGMCSIPVEEVSGNDMESRAGDTLDTRPLHILDPSKSFYFFFVPVGGIGTRGITGHFPLPLLVPVVLPEASRRVPVTKPDEPLVVWLPVDRPEASRKLVRLPLVPFAREVALPVIRPLASR